MSEIELSVLLPAYNEADNLTEVIPAIAAALGDTGRTWEIVVVDDGSTDDLDSVMAPYRDRVTYLKKTNGGVASALNAGIRAARGKYVSTCDADDVQHPWLSLIHI